MILENPFGLQRPLWRDASHWAGTLNFDISKINGVHGYFIKACQGNSWYDAMFLENWENLGKSGLFRSAYTYYMAEQTPESQFELLKGVCPDRDTIPPVLDFEVNYIGYEGDLVQMKYDWAEVVIPISRKQVADNLWTFCELVKDHYGEYPIFYSRKNVIDFWLGSWTSEQKNSLYWWIALYSRNRAIEHPGEPELPNGVDYENVILHQTADLKPGFPGETTSKDIDWNRWEIGNEEQMLKWIDAVWGSKEDPVPVKEAVKLPRRGIRFFRWFMNRPMMR
jgi:hypothetical protein